MLHSVKLAMLASVLVASAASAVVTVTVEAPAATNTTLAVVGGVATFDAVPTGATVGYSTGFGASGITGTFTSFNVLAADQYGGAGGAGNYAAVLTGTSTTVTFSGTPVTYVGFYGSAIDSTSNVQLFNGATLVYSGNMPLVPVTAGHFGNPNAPFAGQNAGEAYAFFNLSSDTAFTSIVFSEGAAGGAFEFDNLTAGNLAQAVVPEPASWALMIVGFMMVGFASRRRSKRVFA